MSSFKLLITERDIDILQFINTFGFCEMPQLEKRFGLKKPRSYQIVNRLISARLLKYERLFHLRSRHGIYRLTRKGAQLTDLPPLDCLPVGYYQHQLSLVELYLKLITLYPEAIFIPERKLKQEKYFTGVGKRGHLSDGLLIFADGKQVALEVELSIKGKARLEKILKSYGTQFEYKEVWYFCSDKVKRFMEPLILKMPYIKLYNLAEFLA